MAKDEVRDFTPQEIAHRVLLARLNDLEDRVRDILCRLGALEEVHDAGHPILFPPGSQTGERSQRKGDK